MDDSELQYDFRPPLLTRRRIGVLLVPLLILVGASIWAWWSMVRMPGTPYAAEPPPLDEASSRIAEQLEHDVRALASFGEKSIARARALDEAATFVEERLAQLGFKVERQRYAVRGVSSSNLIARLPGTSTSELIVIGAHYDSAHGSPGANDNASGVAALLALAERLGPRLPW